MRRRDKEVTDHGALEGILDGAEWGTLGLVTPEGHPRLVPLNFVRLQDRIYFHGSPSGEKMEVLKASGEAVFLVVDAYAQIPSYAFDPVSACPASQFFKSVMLHGRVAEVADPERKAEVLEALMRKLQPEGGYETITASSPTYAGLRNVAVLEMTVERMSGKFGLGQKLRPEQRATVLDLLEQRGKPGDLRTMEAMATFPSAPAGPGAAGAGR